MSSRFYLLFFPIFLAASLPAQIDTGFRFLKSKQWKESQLAFSKDTADAQKAAVAYFGLAKAYIPLINKSLDDAITCSGFVEKTLKLLKSRQGTILKFAQKNNVTTGSCRNLSNKIAVLTWAGVEERKSWKELVLFWQSFPEFCDKNQAQIEKVAWSIVKRDKTFESLDGFRERFPVFFKQSHADSVVSLRREIVRKTYEITSDYKTLSRLVRFYSDLLYNDNITMDSDVNIRLWSAFCNDHDPQNFEQFIKDHPDHWASNDCWASQAAAALKEGSLKNLISFCEEFPYSYISYSLIPGCIDANFRNDLETINTLSETERSRLDEILETLKLDDCLSDGGRCNVDTSKLLSLIRLGAPSWRSFFLLRAALDNYIRIKDWDRAIWLISSTKSLFPNIMPDKCRLFSFRREAWLSSMEDILKLPYEPINPRPLTTLNTEANEVLPFISADRKTFYFTADGRADGFRQEDPYEVPLLDTVFGEPQLIKGLAGKQNESLLSITADGREALVFVDGMLYYSKMSDTGWSKPEKISEFFNAFAWVGKATITADGSALVFEAIKSRSLYGQPNIDIYVALRDEKGDWGKPIPLPSNINTRAKERSPYIHTDGHTLYFSSNGHLGLGGMDIFKTSRLDDTWQKWEEPQNVGKEINTIEDDWGVNFSITADGETFFFSQTDNYHGKKGELMIGKLPKKVAPEPIVVIEIPVNSPAPIQLQAKNRDGKAIQNVTVPSGKSAAIFILNISGGPVTITLKDSTFLATPIFINLNEKRLPNNTDTLKPVSVKDVISGKSVFEVHFDRSESGLSPETEAALDNFYQAIQGKTLRFNIIGHTDDVGTFETNKKLSEDRANAVKNYLVNLGYSKTLIVTNGQSSSKPKLQNTSEKNRAANRRVEIQFAE